MRHPQWQTNNPEDDKAVEEEESFNDSLKDEHDMSLRLSIDGDLAAASGGTGLDMQDQVKRILSKIRKTDSGSNGNGGGNINMLLDNVTSTSTSTNTSKYPLLRRRRRLIVIALDFQHK